MRGARWSCHCGPAGEFAQSLDRCWTAGLGLAALARKLRTLGSEGETEENRGVRNLACRVDNPVDAFFGPSQSSVGISSRREESLCTHECTRDTNQRSNPSAAAASVVTQTNNKVP